MNVKNLDITNKRVYIGKTSTSILLTVDDQIYEVNVVKKIKLRKPKIKNIK